MVIFIDFFFKFINKYGLFLIYSFIFLEYSCFPLPSEVILPTAGAFAQSNNINVFLIILFSIFISLLASIICYLIGRFGNKYFLPKIQKKMNKSISTCLNYFNKYGSLSICFGRLIPLCRTYISFFAGLNKFNIFKYIFYSSIGIGLWNTILILLGYNFYNNLDFIIEIYNKYTIINKEKLNNYLNNHLTLSYSSMDNYYHCAFKYYINNILRLCEISFQ